MTIKNKQHSFSLNLPKLPKSETNLTLQAGITADELQTINDSRLKYALLMNGDDNCYVDAKTLHESLGKPQGDFKDWVRRNIKPFIIEMQSSYLEMFTESGRQKIISFENLQPTDTENTSGKTATTQKRGGRPKDIYLKLEDAQDLAMLTRTPEGAEVRKYFRTVHRVYEKCINNNELREEIEKNASRVAKQAGLTNITSTGRFDMVQAGKAKKRLNHLVMKAVGARNIPDTDLKAYANIQDAAALFIQRGMTDENILIALGAA